MPIPAPGLDAGARFVADHLGHVAGDAAAPSPRFRGGQAAADAALAAFDVGGYARRRNQVHPPDARGASALSPYIRHGMLDLPRVWHAVADGPGADVRKFRDELLWQEFARHWYARLGARTSSGLRRRLPGHDGGVWDRRMRCVDRNVDELHTDGWVVNQARMWLSSQWSVRDRYDWTDGEDEFFRHLLDGSRAANRLGWQWTIGIGSSKPYGFSRWQVQKRAAAFCASCELAERCPIRSRPDDPTFAPVTTAGAVRHDRDVAATAGPAAAEMTATPEWVWLTGESLGVSDPASVAHPDLPLVFVFDEPLLARLQLSAKRLAFLVETLAELGARRELTLWLGEPAEVLAGQCVAVTFAPVPGFRRLRDRVDVGSLHPWPWLSRPHDGSVSSFSAWRKRLGPPSASR